MLFSRAPVRLAIGLGVSVVLPNLFCRSYGDTLFVSDAVVRVGLLGTAGFGVIGGLVVGRLNGELAPLSVSPLSRNPPPN